MIAEETISELMALSIEKVVQAYDIIELKKVGRNYKALSPWGREKTASFHINTAKNIFKCFSSGKGGNNGISFVMQLENLDFVSACRSLAAQHGITIQEDGVKATPEDQAKKEAIREAIQWACGHFCSNTVPESFRKNRSFPEAICERFRLGFAKPGWDNLLIDAKKAGQSLEGLVMAGLLKKKKDGGYYDAFRDRVMIPITDYRGNVVGFTGRLAGTVKTTEQDIAKYIHSEGLERNNHLFGLSLALQDKKLETSGAYLVEGPTDVMRGHLHNLTNTVGIQGSSFTDTQAKLLRRFTDMLTIIPDNDQGKEKNAGLEALDRNAAVALRTGFKVKVLIPGKKN